MSALLEAYAKFRDLLKTRLAVMRRPGYSYDAKVVMTHMSVLMMMQMSGWSLLVICQDHVNRSCEQSCIEII